MSILKNKREELKYSREEMAKKLNTNSNVIGFWERLERFPKPNNLYNIIKQYELSDSEAIEYLKEIYNKCNFDTQKIKEKIYEKYKDNVE